MAVTQSALAQLALQEGLGLTQDEESVYLQYLPMIYRQDAFMRRFIMIFETILRPIEQSIDSLYVFTDPDLAPASFLPWLGQWVALALDSGWPVDRQRALINHAVEIYRWRGTARGIKLHIKCYTGLEPIIQEYRGGFVLGRESGLGWTTQLATMEPNTLLFVVTVPVRDPRLVDPQVLRTIIEEVKPGHTTYRLRLVRAHLPEPSGAVASP